MVEVKTPTLIAIARMALANELSFQASKSTILSASSSKSKKVEDDDSDDEIIIGGSRIATSFNNPSFMNQDSSDEEDSDEEDSDEEDSDEDSTDNEYNHQSACVQDENAFAHGEQLLDGPQASPLQLAARFPLRVNKKYYINRVTITKERTSKTSQSYWAIGPFESNVDAKPLATAIRRKMKSSGITTNKFVKDNHQNTFEVLIPDKGMKMDKRTKKRNLGSETSTAMEQGVLDEVTELLPIILETLDVKASSIYAPNILVDDEDDDGLFA
jgi:hypothetical protein